MEPPSSPRTVLRELLIAVAAITLLVSTATALSESCLSLGPFEGLARSAGRVAWWARFPVLPLCLHLFPPIDHHLPPRHVAATCLLAPWLWGLAAVTALRVGPALLRSGAGRGLALLLSTSLALGAAIGVWAVLVEPGLVTVRSYRVPIPDLPETLDGTRLALITDTHHGPYVSAPYVERVAARVRALDVDLVLLGGDYVHRTPRAIPVGMAVLAGMRGRHGSVAVLGNHDHWEGTEASRAAIRAAGIPLVDNAHVFLDTEGLHGAPPPGGALCIAGIADPMADRPDWEAALAGVSPDMPRLVLTHNPDAAERIPAGLRVDLLCAGHTHGGQVRLPFLGPPIVPSAHGSRYEGGLVQGPRGPVVVSRGVGMAAAPLRLGVRPEIVVVELLRAP